jgi:hypothetical protein
MLPLQIASEYVSIFMPFTQFMVIFIVIKLKLKVKDKTFFLKKNR